MFNSIINTVRMVVDGVSVTGKLNVKVTTGSSGCGANMGAAFGAIFGLLTMFAGAFVLRKNK